MTFILPIVAALTTLTIAYAEVHGHMEIVWVDDDMNDIDEPKERRISFAHAVLESVFIQQLNQTLDVPRVARKIAGRPKQAANVNALDEVPDSSWYTNRHYLRAMTIEELSRGPNQEDGPNFDSAVIVGGKMMGVTPGLQVKDTRGDRYLIKFDHVDYPELQSGAEIVSTKILYAAGYNVPANYIAVIHPDRLDIAESAQIDDPESGAKRRFTRADLQNMLSRVSSKPDGGHRVLASRIIPGKPKGPFPQAGVRPDDPNDRIPHEHRRELRGLRVIASWINHWDTKEENSLDMYVNETGKRFIRHYLIDFGSTLGGGQHPMEYFHGRESAFDARSIFKEVFSLGFYESANEKNGAFISPAMAIFSNRDFDPGGWRPSLPAMPFENMTDEDAFWGTRVILSFSADQLRRIIQTAEYTNSKDAEYLLQTLLERREMIARHWLAKVNPVGDFQIQSDSDSLALSFKDLMLEHNFAPERARYSYQVRTKGGPATRAETREERIVLDPSLLTRRADDGIEITVWTKRRGAMSEPVRVYLSKEPAQGRLRIVGISRA
jgi:hypothetical protein